MYTIPILWMLSWPVLILVSWYLVKWAIKKYEKRSTPRDTESQ